MSGKLSEVRRGELLELARHTRWYHSFELERGFVTEGEFDLRKLVHHYGLPDSMAGMRVADVGTFDGFWAFEMERRGAEVVAFDLEDASQIDWPAFRPRPEQGAVLGQGFQIVRELSGSQVERVCRSVYDLDPHETGDFDLVFCGSLLIHLKNQFRALERMRRLLRPGGGLITAEPYDRLISLLPFPAARYRASRPLGAAVYWEPGIKTWALMIEACGFSRVRRESVFTMRSPRGYSVRHVVHHAAAD